MYSAPAGYSDIQEYPFRSEGVYMSMGVYIDNTAADDITAITADKLPMSNVAQLTNAIYQLADGLATYEAEGIPTGLSAGMQAPPIALSDAQEYGLWSEDISDGNGDIDFSFTIRLSASHTSALTIYTSGPNITEGTVLFSVGDGEPVEESLDPHTGYATASGSFTFDTITVNITGIDAPYCHVRVAEIEFGDSVTIGMDQLANQVTFIDEIDPLQIGLPMQELDFDLINISGDYDEDKPNSLYSRLAIGNPINLSYTLAKGRDRVTIPMGRFVIGERGSKNNCVSVTAYDVRWRLLNMYNSWSIDPSIDLATSINAILTALDVAHTIDAGVSEIYPMAAYTFSTDTSVLDDLHRIAQAYGLTILPDRGGTVVISQDFVTEDYGDLPVQNQISWPEASQLNKYNAIDVIYGTEGNLDHYFLAQPLPAYTARSVITINNRLVVTLAQAQAIANRIMSRLYAKAIKVKWLADPALDLYDQVGVFSQWTQGETAEVFKAIKREITYNGILTEETTFVR